MYLNDIFDISYGKKTAGHPRIPYDPIASTSASTTDPWWLRARPSRTSSPGSGPQIWFEVSLMSLENGENNLVQDLQYLNVP